jgi:drug/metabolite transporter (DMT)-like permease
MPPEKTLLYQLAVSGLALTCASALSHEAWPALATLSVKTWAHLGFQIVVVSFASYLVWFWLVRHYPATRVAAFTLLTPLFGLLAGVGLLGEPLTTAPGGGAGGGVRRHLAHQPATAHGLSRPDAAPSPACGRG